MSFRGWTKAALEQLLEADGFTIPPGTTEEELQIFAAEEYAGEANVDNIEDVYVNDNGGNQASTFENANRSYGSMSGINSGAFENANRSYGSMSGLNSVSFAQDEQHADVIENGVEDEALPTAMASFVTIDPTAYDEKGGAYPTGAGLQDVPTTTTQNPHHRRRFSQPTSHPSENALPGWAPLDEDERHRNAINDEARYDLEVGEYDTDYFAKPTKEAALEYRKLHHPRTMDGLPFSVLSSTMGRLCFTTGPIGVGFDWLCEGAVSEMARYGSGLSLHFKTLKFLFWMFFFASCISLPQLVLNSQTVDFGGGLFVTTIGNLFTDSNRTYAFLCASASASNSSSAYICRYSVAELSLIYAYTDLVLTLLFAVGLLWLHYFVTKEPMQVSKLFLSLDRYSVWVPKLPPGCGEIPLAQYLESVTGETVDEVNIAFNEGQLISLFIERGEVLSELWRVTGRALLVAQTEVKSTALRNEEEMLMAKADRLERIIDYYDLLLTTYHSLNEQTRGFSQTGARAISGIVTFEKRIGALKALEIFSRSRVKKDSKVRKAFVRAFKLAKRLVCCLFFSSQLAAKQSEVVMEEEIPDFQGMQITCENAPAPSTILWENLEYGFWPRIARQLLATVFVCIAIGASFGASFGSQAYRAEIKVARTSDCNSNSIDCLCASYSYARASSSIFETSDQCHLYWVERAPLFAFTLFVTAVVSFVNFVVSHVTINLSYFERHHSLVSTDLSVAGRLFIAYSLNTAFVYVVVNVILGGFDSLDLTATWYSDVGTQILLTMLLNVIAPHLVLVYEILYRLWVRKLGDKPLLQREMNERYVGNEFPYAVRSAQVFMQAFICLVFGPGMPLLYPIAAVSFVLYFYVDKWSVLRFYRTPPEYDAQMAEVLIIVLWASVFGHLCFAIWTYSVPGLFWTGSEALKTASMGSYLFTRATLPNTLPLLILLFFLICLWFATYTLYFTWRTVLTSTTKVADTEAEEIKLNINEDLPPLYDAKASGYLRGLRSYNILQNPKYRRAFGVPKSFCDEHSHVSSVLALPGGDVLPELPDEVRKALDDCYMFAD